jgi:glucans biosynthesis protein
MFGRDFGGSGLVQKIVGFLTLALAIGGEGNALAAGPGFSYETVRERARALATTDYHPPDNRNLPDFLKNLTYDAYQQIRFREDHTLWASEPFRFAVQYFQRGYLYQDPVKIHIIDAGKVRDIASSPDYFDFGTNRFNSPVPANIDFAGFRLLYPLNMAQKRDEVASFLGASYFRVLGSRQRYGASLRGVAVNTAEPSGEEFPRFTEFWIEQPPQMAAGIRVLALMDSPSLTGAYSFAIEPGAATVVDVQASLFFRKGVQKLGVAAMSSLFLKGQNESRFVPDFRPQVHDSDGLCICSSGSNWLWRPLVNPEKKHRVTNFPVSHLKGFGLLQRDREFRDYQDLEARFELRPSYWIEPQGDWGQGTIELVEIPTGNDWNDNVVAYWVPSAIPAAGQNLYWSYRISALSSDPDHSALMRVRSTFLAPEHDGTPAHFVIDFTGDKPAGADPMAGGMARVTAAHGGVQNLVVQSNDVLGGFRAFFDLTGTGDGDDQMRLGFNSGKAPWSETWVYDYQK